ncbi:type II CRISPR-associated endonuclease Cas1 [Ruminococcus sp.]|uniref:type II CRISPR-associated endonuclease Cas1 n=1 Tax=Ruminococcus sp. TaxID=41978 RepID=UPI0025CC5CDA|nr:type II CRISPR-associated endonuclease Cas1 [Ruminococcus sp.]MBQ6252075.1 type II CRISPR-associated endonuclease Cas1 [Ruminococcus sp.]
MNNGWKRIVIKGNADLNKSDNCLLVTNGDGKNKTPVNQINSIIIESEQVKITSSLMVFLIENNVSIIFCDGKHNPCFETIPFNGNTFSSGRLAEQFNWNKERKRETGCDIIRLKIQNQANLLKRVGIADYVYLESLLLSIDEDNMIAIEAEAAKVYFHGLFGKGFQRRTECSINSALNYGYAILLSTINRIIVSYGYNTSLGLNHHSNKNHFNLSCDIIEPFRPFVDEVAYENMNADFDRAYKTKLLSICSNDIRYNNSIITLESALDLFTMAVIKRMTDEVEFKEMIGFA